MLMYAKYMQENGWRWWNVWHYCCCCLLLQSRGSRRTRI